MDGMDGRSDSEKCDEADSIGLGFALEAFKEYKEIRTLCESIPNIFDDEIQSERVFQRYVYILNQYQEQPHLLDRDLDEFLILLLDIARNESHNKKKQHLAFKFMYIITKVRGYKVVIRHLPHEVTDVEAVLHMLDEQDPQDHETWETRYMLLLWMSIIVMIPFHMTRLDDTRDLDSSGKKPIMERILITVKLYLSVGDKARDAAAFLAARFFTRPDVKSVYLGQYLDWSMQMLTEIDSSTMIGLNLQAGILSSLALLFKHGKREDLNEYGPLLLKRILECHFKDSVSTNVRKMALKLLQRIGLSFLKMKVTDWRYSRGTRSLSDNLAQGDCLKAHVPTEHKPLPEIETDSEMDDEYDIPDETEDVIDQLLMGLRDKDTVLRWSAAKGIGRITSRLPKELADDIVTSVLDLFSFRESDSAWHGGCLALAELARRGLVLPQHLDEVVKVVLKALVYDELRGNFSVGAHIRDAACYVCWSFARAYDPQILQPYINCIAGALLVTAVFDREINCRRAAAAAFQENVGRQGTLPYGIEILTNADYYAVGSRQNAFLNLSVFIGQYSEYILVLIKHLLDYKVNHWDSAIRELSSKALHNLTALSCLYMAEHALPELLKQARGTDLNTRHGALLAVAEIVHGLYEIARQENKDISAVLGPDTLDGIRNIVFILKEKKYFRGLGGILTRCAVCLLVEKASVSRLPFHDDGELIDVWQEIIDSSLEHTELSVRSAAISALPHFCTCFYLSDVSKGSKILLTYLANRKVNNLASRCGYVLVIGAFPKFILETHIDEVIQGLSDSVKIEGEHSSWAEARRDAITALSEVVATMGINSIDGEKTIGSENLDIIFHTFLLGLEDYTVDSRGEIGAIVREAAMLAIQKVIMLVVEQDVTMLEPDVVLKIFKAISQQCVEKIDRTRLVAGKVFSSLLHSDVSIPHIPDYDELLKVFPKTVCDDINWASPADTFHLFVQLLPLENFVYNILLGFTVSVGGLTESLVKYSRSSLVGYLKSVASDNELSSRISDTFIAILKNNIRNDGIFIPFVKMMDHLFVSSVELQNSDKESSFNGQLVDLIWQAAHKTGDPQKLIAVIDLFCDLLQFEGPIFKRTLSRLAIFLCHRFPRVRILAANKMYEAFVSYDLLPNEVQDDVLLLLSETDWNDNVEKLRPIRNELCEKIGVPTPTPMKK